MSSYFDINSKNDTFAPYLRDNSNESNIKSSSGPAPDSKITEGATDYTAGDFADLVASMSSNKVYDMDSRNIYNPSDPEYVPTIKEAALEDKNQLIVQQNTVLALSAMSAATIGIVLYMISNRS